MVVRPSNWNSALFEFFDADTGTLFDDFFKDIARMDLCSRDIHRNGSGKIHAAFHAFHFKVGVDRLFLFRDVFKTNEVVFCEVFHCEPTHSIEGKILWVCQFLVNPYTEMNSKVGNLARRRPEFEPGEAGAEAAQLE